MSSIPPPFPPNTGAQSGAPAGASLPENRSKSKEEIQNALAGINLLQFRPETAAMPTQLYVHTEDVITVFINNIAAGAVLILLIRFLRMDGTIVPLQYNITPTSDGSLTFKSFPLAEGFILGVTVTNNGNGSKRGQCYCVISLNRAGISGFASQQVLCARYIEADPICGWPYPSIQSPSEGPGFFNSVIGTTPAAGAEITETVPARQIWELKSLALQLTTSATVATRGVQLVFFDPAANPMGGMISGVAQGALSVIKYMWGEGLNFTPGAGWIGSGPFTAPLTTGVMLRPGWSIRTTTINLQAGDQFSAPAYIIQQWIEP